MWRTKQSLLFTRHRHEDDRRVEFVFRHHARHLQNGRRARRVVVCAGRVALGIGWAGTHRIVVAADDINSIGRFGLSPFQRRHHVREHRRLWNTRGFGLLECLFLYSHSPARLLRGLHEFAVEPIARGADASIRIVLIRQSVAGAETYQFADRVFDVPSVNLRNDF